MFTHSKNHNNWTIWVIAFLFGWMMGCEPNGDDDDVADDDTTSDDDTALDDDDDTALDDDDTALDDDDDDFSCDVPLDFQEIRQGEDYGGDGTEEWDDCDDITVLMLESQPALETAYQEYLPSVPPKDVPTNVDFDSEMALFSFGERCPWDGNSLTVNAVCLEENVLVVYETFLAPEMGIEMAARVYNVSLVPTGEYESVSLELTVEYDGS